MNIPGLTKSLGNQSGMFLIVGEPWTGKTTSAATFPEPLFLDFDHKVPAGFDVVPFWDGAFCDTCVRRTNPNQPPNKRDALLYWLGANLGKIPRTRTVILDSVTAVEKAFHNQTEVVEGVPISKKTGEADGFYVWKKKLEYFNALFDILKTYPGLVIVIMHEQPELNEAGMPTGRVKPLMSGSFVHSIGSHFTAMFRQRTAKRKDTGAIDYVWDTRPTQVFASNNTLFIDKSPIKATYEELKPYLEKLSAGQVAPAA